MDATIRAIRLYDVPAIAHGTGQKVSGGRVFKHFRSCIVAVETTDGTVGWGETMPYNSNYLPAFAAGARAGLQELAPALIGCDVRAISVLQARMDHTLYGHGYAKVGLEMAAWDALGKLSRWPLYLHFGGMLSPEPQISAHIGAMADEDRPERMARYRSFGIRQFSCKATGDVVADIAYVRWLAENLAPGESAKLDANGAWRVDEGIRVLRAAQDLPLWFEQPCQTYEECRDLRRAVAMPIILDECADSLSLLIRAYEDRVLDAVSLKPAKNGGIAHTLAMRDFLSHLGKPMHVQDAAGTDIVNAMIAHIAHSIAPRRLLYIWDAHNLIETVTATGGPDGSAGRLCAADRPGLGVTPILTVLGEPLAVFE
jgi:cis-L-3-hydroxyproline dehydratase